MGIKAMSDPLPPNSANRMKKQRAIRSIMSRTTPNLFTSIEFTVDRIHISREEFTKAH